jgi:hypothetical protein
LRGWSGRSGSDAAKPISNAYGDRQATDARSAAAPAVGDDRAAATEHAAHVIGEQSARR